MIGHLLIDEVTKIATTRNEYGDFVLGESETINCRFREINDITRGVDGREELDADAMIHVATDSSVELNDILSYQGNGYKVTEITKARRGGETGVQFKKCLLTRERGIS